MYDLKIKIITVTIKLCKFQMADSLMEGEGQSAIINKNGLLITKFQITQVRVK